ncbi:MAG: hypothetical protein R3250_00060 [Melioribacteraceae bacterium]|nr:hypothetical protein [Melioribacteraceae bacterium]
MSTLLAYVGYYAPRVEVRTLPDFSVQPDPTPLPSSITTDVSLSPDGAYMAVAVNNSTKPIIVWETTNWTEITLPSLPSNTGDGVDFSNDGQYLAYVQYGSPCVHVWNVSDWSKVNLGEQVSYGGSIRFSENSNYLAVGTWETRGFAIYDTSTWTILTGFDSPPVSALCTSIDINETADVVACFQKASPFLTVYDLTTKAELWRNSTDITSASEDNSKILSINFGGSALAVGHNSNSRINIYNPRTGAGITGPSPMTTRISSVRYNSDGSNLIVASENNSMRYFETSTWTYNTISPNGIWPYGTDFDGPTGEPPIISKQNALYFGENF